MASTNAGRGVRQAVRLAVRSLRSRTERKLARWKFAASVRPSDVFIVTYPKSGTVWLSFLVANILHRDREPSLTLRTYRDYISNINRHYFEHGSLREFGSRPDPRCFWLHARYEEVFPTVLYVLRDPRDVMVSYWHWKKLSDARYGLTLPQFLAGDDPWPCAWDAHVSEWLLTHNHPRLMQVRYEDLQRDTAGVLGRVVDFLRLPHSSEDIERAVAAGRFERMKALEESLRSRGESYGVDKPGETPLDPAERFMRRGKVGSWKDELDSESLRRLESRFGRVMRAVGYEPAS